MLLNPYRFGSAAPSGDPYWDKRVALLHFDGADGSTVFTDQKGLATWGAGGTAALTTVDPKFGATQFASGSAGHAGTGNVAAFNVGNQEFCFEGFLTMVSLPASFATLVSWNTNTGTYAQARLDVRSTGALALLISDSNNHWVASSDSVIAGGSVAAGTRAFVRFGRTAGVAFIEINGTTVVSYAADVTCPSYSAGTLLGGYNNPTVAGRPVVRWDEVRMTVGRSEQGQGVPIAPFPNAA